MVDAISHLFALVMLVGLANSVRNAFVCPDVFMEPVLKPLNVLVMMDMREWFAINLPAMTAFMVTVLLQMFARAMLVGLELTVLYVSQELIVLMVLAKTILSNANALVTIMVLPAINPYAEKGVIRSTDIVIYPRPAFVIPGGVD